METVFTTTMIVFLYLGIGLIGTMMVSELIDRDYNPLWNIPLVLIGPGALVILFGMIIWYGIKRYIDSVKRYYERKGKRKRREIDYETS